ncbi:hypothetical protein TBH_C1249 [Thiolapillus brandeum]|uniref:Uncharacterized protein n=1 Tax=Thiolapillus brandeum TaxID=1076588 RepID=A0A7U6GID0_9GAMM|nr:hypothetical protein TBH_C1249 [Thiolapillus brandeum]
MENPETSISNFSKHLLITIFAIFAFTSGPLIEAPSLSVKILYSLSLLLAILSMYYSFKAILGNVNEIINNYENTGYRRLTIVALKEMKKKLQNQYYASLGALVFLASSIFVYLFN